MKNMAIFQLQQYPRILQLLDDEPRVAVLIPCYNEETTIGRVVGDFKKVLPAAVVYVYDNSSDDRTPIIAQEAGAVVRVVPLRGKGNVVRRMFADIDANIYVLVDGDDTYDPSSATCMIKKLITEQLDMVVGVRVAEDKAAYRLGHQFGNSILTNFVTKIFGRGFTDMLSGYRVMSRRFVKSYPAIATGFEIETELSVHALQLRLPFAEFETPYKARPQNSQSKLNTYRDGLHILMTIFQLFKMERPLMFFGIFSVLLATAALVLMYPVLITYLETGLVPRFPTAILSTGLMLLAFLSLACGLILDTVTRGRQELKRLFYLSIPPVYENTTT